MLGTVLSHTVGFHQCEVRHTQRIEQLRIFEHFAYCVFLTRITYCVLRIACCCHFDIQFEPHSVLRIAYWLRIGPPSLTLIAYCVLRIAYCVLPSPILGWPNASFWA